MRSRHHPRGYPWLRGRRLSKCQDASFLLGRTLEAARAGHASAAKAGFLLEHPEDFGVTPTGGSPASIWQLPELHTLLNDTTALQGALRQCRFGVDYAKPTRLAGTLDSNCGHRHRQRLVGTNVHDQVKRRHGQVKRRHGQVKRRWFADGAASAHRVAGCRHLGRSTSRGSSRTSG